jgi:hypothetical protein
MNLPRVCQVVKDFGMNVIRLHQKVNPQRWYLHADSIGVVVLQVRCGHAGLRVGPPVRSSLMYTPAHDVHLRFRT